VRTNINIKKFKDLKIILMKVVAKYLFLEIELMFMPGLLSYKISRVKNGLFNNRA